MQQAAYQAQQQQHAVAAAQQQYTQQQALAAATPSQPAAGTALPNELYLQFERDMRELAQLRARAQTGQLGAPFGAPSSGGATSTGAAAAAGGCSPGSSMASERPAGLQQRFPSARRANAG